MPHKKVTRNGVKIPSVTEIINVLEKQGLVYWYGKYGTAECNRIKNEAAAFGTHVHDLIERYLTGNKDGEQFAVTPEETACFDNFKEWYNKFGLVPISTEPEDAVISTRFNFQGTWDFIGRYDNAIIVADWKTSNQLYDTVGLQLAAYAQLYGESQGWDGERIWRTIPNGLAVRIDKKTAKVYTKWFKDLRFYFDVFQSLLLPYQFVHHTGAWEKPETAE